MAIPRENMLKLLTAAIERAASRLDPRNLGPRISEGGKSCAYFENDPREVIANQEDHEK
jgi:hypothetical protein